MLQGTAAAGDITRLLDQWREGDDTALERLTPLIYDELRRLARGYLRSEPSGGTMQATALVHEVFLRSAGLRKINWESRGQFIAAAAKVMRNVLVDHARKKGAAKRGGCASEDRAEPNAPDSNLDVLEVHLALDKFSAEYPRHAQVVELIFFGGLNAAETAEILTACGTTTSPRTVERDWSFARGWLYRELRGS
jgi:RNA polymerase sigma-70 factor, ECF subfamily